jgi:RNA polymerase sigma-70 factor (ECF subfamily)
MRDETALVALYDRYAGLVFTLASRMLHESSLAEGVMQDVFVRCWHGQERFERGRRTVPGWLLGVTRQQAVIALRAPQPERPPRRGRPPAEPIVSEVAVPERDEAATLRAAVVQAVGELSPAQREVIEQAYFGGLTQSEIAQRLGQSVDTVKVRLRDGMRRLRRLLGPTLDSQETGVDAAW